LTRLEREIRAYDSHARRKYLQDFSSAFRNYESVLDSRQLAAAYRTADMLLVGDYHALPASQHFAASLIRQLSADRPVVLALEVVFARHQDILDNWRLGAIGAGELRERMRFDRDWGYDWSPFYEVLESGRAHALAIYGLDCMPRNDLRRIGARDRHAAAKLAEIRERHPEAAVVVLFGEAHLAPGHIPGLLRARRPQDRILTVLQNVDALYWRAAGEMRSRVEAVRVGDDVICVFNSTPLEKYESYRLWLDRWRQENVSTPDLAPVFYNLVDALLRFLNIDKYSASNHTQPRFVVDQLPEVYSDPSEERVRRLLACRIGDESEIQLLLARLQEQGCCYVPEARAILVRQFRLAQGAEEATRFVHRVCRDPQEQPNALNTEDRFYASVIEHALAYFGSRALHAPRPPAREADIYAKYSLPPEAVKALHLGSDREFRHLIDFLVLHKQYEGNLRRYRACPELLSAGVRCEGEPFQFLTRQLGYLLGSELYDGYLEGRVAKRFLRSLFFRSLDRSGVPRTVYFATQRKLRRRKRPG
jgi:hypothetical protein